MTPGLAHALLALGLQAVHGAPFALLFHHVSFGPFTLAGMMGGAVAYGFYLGRERRQAEEFWGSNRLDPWIFRPRSLRDLGWPLGAVAASTALIASLGLLR